MINHSQKKVLIVSAHPEPASLTHQLVRVTKDTLEAQGHEVMESDLYAMRWKAVLDGEDFPQRADPKRLSLIMESYYAYANGQQTSDVVAEQAKLTAADAVILQFPLWWFGVPAIMKGWIERVYAYGFGYGYRNEGNNLRYGEGALKGKRALLCVLTGGPETDYGPRGINGPIDQLLFPLTHGTLFYAGMDVLPLHTVYAAAHFKTVVEVDAAKQAWGQRVAGLFSDAPIRFRAQNGGDYISCHTLRDDLAPGASGLPAHVALGES